MKLPAMMKGEARMLKQWAATWDLWAKNLAGFDDLQGEHLLRLEQRVRRLEEELSAPSTQRPSEPDPDGPHAAPRGHDAAKTPVTR
ncbi:hypothetical protein [Phaeovulum sp. W22_SRMD_FR3]|uniref:hypothetical protein n=1 Tax=Phaeovulum sp. W22_SRMD_FR3 TaxID=3240274 RepID=UPI003F97E8EB